MLSQFIGARSTVRRKNDSLFPAISAGAYGYPMKEAAQIALSSMKAFIDEHPGAFEEIRFVLFLDEALKIYQEAWSKEAWSS